MRIVLLLLLVGNVCAQKIVLKGSDTLGAKMVPMLVKGYKSTGNKVDFEIAAEGSSQAFTNLLAGTADIGMSSRDVKEEEKERFKKAGIELVEHVAAYDMITVVVNAKNPVENLTLKQIEGIFTGDITDWSEVGGEAGKISVYTRNTSSGTFKTFQNMAMSNRPYGESTQKIAGGEIPELEVIKNPAGILYVGLARAGRDGLKAVEIDGISAKPENKDRYALSRKLCYYTVGEPEGEVKRFLDWAMKSEAAAEIIEKVGFIPAK